MAKKPSTITGPVWAAAVIGLLACGGAKSPPAADCDAFATRYASALSRPTDGELTKKAIEIQAVTFKTQCRTDHWSEALISCILRNVDGNIFNTCANELSPEQAKRLKDVLHDQTERMDKAILQGAGGTP